MWRRMVKGDTITLHYFATSYEPRLLKNKFCQAWQYIHVYNSGILRGLRQGQSGLYGKFQACLGHKETLKKVLRNMFWMYRHKPNILIWKTTIPHICFGWYRIWWWPNFLFIYFLMFGTTKFWMKISKEK